MERLFIRRRGSTEKGSCLVNRLILARIQSSALVLGNESPCECGGGMAVFETVGRGSTPRWGNVMRVDGGRLRVDGQRRIGVSSSLTINPRPSTLNNSPSSGCGGGTRLCEGRGPGSTPGEDTFVTTLKSHGVAAACNAAFSGFDSHRRLLKRLKIEG